MTFRFFFLVFYLKQKNIIKILFLMSEKDMEVSDEVIISK